MYVCAYSLSCTYNKGAEAAVVDVSENAFDSGLLVAAAVSQKLPVLCIHSTSSPIPVLPPFVFPEMVTVAQYTTPEYV